jgi:hypothetical protein
MFNIANLFGGSTIKKIKLTIQNGHRNVTNGQTGTSGVTSNGTKINEVDLIDQIYFKIKQRIDADKFLSSVIQLAYDDTNIRNGVDSDYFVALHADGSKNTEARGGFVDDNPNDKVYELSMKFAKTVADNYFSKIGIPYVNGQTPNTTFYYAFDETGLNTKQFIIEMGFMSNKEDLDRMSDVEKVASLLLEGMLIYFEQYDETYRYAKNNQHSDGDKDAQIAELIRVNGELREQVKLLLAQHDPNLPERLRAIKLRVELSCEEALNNLKSIKI